MHTLILRALSRSSSPVTPLSLLLMWGFWWPSASHRLKLQVSYSCNLRSFPRKLSSHITALMNRCGQMFSRGVPASFLTLRFNQNVFCLPCCFLFKIVVLTRVHTDNKGLQKLTVLLKIGTAAMFICTKRKKQVLLGRFVSFVFFSLKEQFFALDDELLNIIEC